MDEPVAGRAGWVAALQAFAGDREAALERCELCNAPIGADHAHLIELETRRLLCACAACALLFSSRDAGHYRRVSSRVSRLRDFRLSTAEWEAFRIPINLAFFLPSSNADGVLAFYPGPAGATESALDLAAWDTLVAANPELGELDEDVEALLVNRTRGARDYYRVPVDRCYELAGRMRRHWHGISGGEEVADAIREFFDGLGQEAGAGARAHA